MRNVQRIGDKTSVPINSIIARLSLSLSLSGTGHCLPHALSLLVGSDTGSRFGLHGLVVACIVHNSSLLACISEITHLIAFLPVCPETRAAKA